MTHRDYVREIQLSKMLAGVGFSKLELKPFCIDSVSSTQDFLAQMPSPREGNFVVSKVQTKGRGREGRKWTSDEGGLYLSLELEPNKHISDRITGMCAGSIHHTLTKDYSLKECLIKLPNDVTWKGKKIAGVLVDAALEGDKTVARAGMGVNLNNGPAWNDETMRIATSFRLITGNSTDIDEFLVRLLTNLARRYESLERD